MITRITSDSRETREQEALHCAEPAAVPGGRVEGSAVVAVTTGTWDPYEVWLTRVKKPRDEAKRIRRLGDEQAAIDEAGTLDQQREPAAPPKPSPA